MRSSAAVRCDNLNNLDSVRSLTVICEGCDPDNPLAVPQKNCPLCHGAGRTPVRLLEIVSEIQSSMKPSSPREPKNDDSFLEY